MKRTTIIVVFVLLSLFFATNTFAGSCTHRGCTSRIKAMCISNAYGGSIRFELKDVNPNNANCIPQEGKYFTLYKDHIMFNELFSVAHTAAVAGNNLFFRIVEGSNNCEISYIKSLH